MQMLHAIFVMSVVASSLMICEAQTPSPAPSQPAASALTSSSDILQPALDNVRQTIEGMRIDKWKRGTIRDEADANITTIHRDLQGTLPSLMKTADEAPATVSKVLPVSRNIDALYDVLVHVVEAARVVAPGDQVNQLQSAMDGLEKARVKLDEQLEQTAAAQEKQLGDLRSQVQTQAAQLHAAATPPPAPACPTPAPAKKKKPAAATAKKPAASTTTPNSTTSPAGSSTKPQ